MGMKELWDISYHYKKMKELWEFLYMYYSFVDQT